MTATQLASIAGLILSLAFSYIPGLSDLFAKQDGTRKRLIMAGLILLSAAGALAYKCAGLSECYTANLNEYVQAFIAALVANQAAYLVSPKSTPKA